MPAKFSRDDTRSCFRCNACSPSFRWIALERYPNESGNLEPACAAGLFCESCIRQEIDDYFESFAQNAQPVGADETSDEYLCRELGFTVLPLMLSGKDSKLLAEEINSDSLRTTSVN
jgi:hypothetical protein